MENSILSLKKEVSLKAFPGAKARSFNHHTILLLEDSIYDAAAINVGINDLLSNDICKGIVDMF